VAITPDIIIKRGDVGRTIVRRLRRVLVDDEAGTRTVVAADLTGSPTVRLLLKEIDRSTGALLSSTGGGTCTITNVSAGEVTYTTQTADVGTSRVWAAEFEVSKSGGTDIQTFPSRDRPEHAGALPVHRDRPGPRLGHTRAI
jgi:hypothetical protein